MNKIKTLIFLLFLPRKIDNVNLKMKRIITNYNILIYFLYFVSIFDMFPIVRFIFHPSIDDLYMLLLFPFLTLFFILTNRFLIKLFIKIMYNEPELIWDSIILIIIFLIFSLLFITIFFGEHFCSC